MAHSISILFLRHFDVHSGQKTSGSLVNIEIDAMTQAVVDTVKRVMDGGVSQ